MRFPHRLPYIIALVLLPGILFFAGCARDTSVSTLIDEENIRYEDKQSKNIDSETLTYFDHYPYMKDKNAVYVRPGNAKGEVFVRTIQGADPTSFQTLERGYAKDAKHIFFYDKTIKDADLASFRVLYSSYSGDLDYGYSKDKNYVYFNEKRMEDVDPQSFEVLGNGYVKDKNHVYFLDVYSFQFPKVISEADPKTFHAVGTDFEDENYIYKIGKPEIKNQQ